MLDKILTNLHAVAVVVSGVLAAILASPVIPMSDQLHGILAAVAVVVGALAAVKYPDATPGAAAREAHRREQKRIGWRA